MSKSVNELPNHSKFIENIENKKTTVGVIGLGYVGLPLAKALVSKGYSVLGFDTDLKKITTLLSGKSYIKSLSDDDVCFLNNSSLFVPTTETKCIEKMDVILICVPTPLTKNREPDMSYVQGSANTISMHLRKGQLIVLESTTYPGTTSETLKTTFEKTGLVVGKDIFLAYSPEREDPGNGLFETSSIPKVVGADDPISQKIAVSLYSQIVPKVAEVSSSATAEAVKLTENIFRFINIGLVNELKIIYDKMGIDIWEVIDAAKTKPFGFMPFYPGPGLGGHCIPIDPFYLTWKAREYGVSTQYIELSGQINSSMPQYIIERLREELDLRFSKGLNKTKILIIGMAYKKNIDDVRESPSILIYDLLKEKKSHVDYYDSYVKEIPFIYEHENLHGLKSVDLTIENIKQYDAIVICTDHDDVDYALLVEHSNLIIDTRNAIKTHPEGKNNVIKA